MCLTWIHLILVINRNINNRRLIFFTELMGSCSIVTISYFQATRTKNHQHLYLMLKPDTNRLKYLPLFTQDWFFPYSYTSRWACHVTKDLQNASGCFTKSRWSLQMCCMTGVRHPWAGLLLQHIYLRFPPDLYTDLLHHAHVPYRALRPTSDFPLSCVWTAQAGNSRQGNIDCKGCCSFCWSSFSCRLALLSWTRCSYTCLACC